MTTVNTLRTMGGKSDPTPMASKYSFVNCSSDAGHDSSYSIWGC